MNQFVVPMLPNNHPELYLSCYLGVTATRRRHYTGIFHAVTHSRPPLSQPFLLILNLTPSTPCDQHSPRTLSTLCEHDYAMLRSALSDVLSFRKLRPREKTPTRDLCDEIAVRKCKDVEVDGIIEEIVGHSKPVSIFSYVAIQLSVHQRCVRTTIALLVLRRLLRHSIRCHR